MNFLYTSFMILIIMLVKNYTYPNLIISLYYNFSVNTVYYNNFFEVFFLLQYFYGLYLLWGYQLKNNVYFSKYRYWWFFLNLFYIFLTIFLFPEQIIHADMFVFGCLIQYVNLVLNSIDSTPTYILSIFIFIFIFF